MRLHCNKVYKNKITNIYYYISDVTKSKRRNVYHVRKVSKLGILGRLEKILYKRNTWVTAPEVTVSINITMPKKDKNQAMFDQIVLDAQNELIKYRKNKDDYNGNIMERIGNFAHASISVFNTQEKRNYNVQDFAIALGEKEIAVYKAVMHIYTNSVAPTKKSIQRASDQTIVSCMRNCEVFWPCLHGFYRPLNKIIEDTFKMYTSEYSRRLKKTHSI